MLSFNRKHIEIENEYPGVRKLRERNRLKHNYFKNEPHMEYTNEQKRLSVHRVGILRQWINTKVENAIEDATGFFSSAVSDHKTQEESSYDMISTRSFEWEVSYSSTSPAPALVTGRSQGLLEAIQNRLWRISRNIALYFELDTEIYEDPDLSSVSEARPKVIGMETEPKKEMTLNYNSISDTLKGIYTSVSKKVSDMYSNQSGYSISPVHSETLKGVIKKIKSLFHRLE